MARIPSKKKCCKRRIAIVDDHPIVRRGIASVLADTENLSVCGQAEDIRQAVELLDRAHPDLMIVDLFLNGIIAFDLIRTLRARRPNLPLLVLSIRNEAHFAERALRAGADGYVVKENATQEILKAIYALLDGKIFVSENIVDRMSFTIEDGEGRGRRFVGKLSNRELQVIQLISSGSTVRKIAGELNVSAKTIETYCERLKKKLRLTSAGDLLRFAVEWKSEIDSGSLGG